MRQTAPNVLGRYLLNGRFLTSSSFAPRSFVICSSCCRIFACSWLSSYPTSLLKILRTLFPCPTFAALCLMHEPRTMETLPTEVFNEILDKFEHGLHELPRANPWARPRPYKPEHLDSKQHFARLRLVCKRFSELAAPYLFRSIGLRFNLKSFDRLERLAEQPMLARHVKKFVYLMPYLYDQGKGKMKSNLILYLPSNVNSKNRRPRF